jgi:N-acetyl-gamma-glutamyl-phosphate reductase
MLQGALIGLVVALAMFFWNKRQAKLGTGVAGTIESAFAAAYADRPLVRLSKQPPQLTHAVGSCLALAHAAQSADGTEVQVMIAIDNLLKGAAGQAVQAMNLALGLPETTGLRGGGAFPC